MSANNKSLWPPAWHPIKYEGMDSSQLGWMLDSGRTKSISRLAFFSGSEVYGLGKTLRLMLNWPARLPIPFSSDHGIAVSSRLEDHELNAISPKHLTWSRWRLENLQGKKIVAAPHPWVHYRRNAGYKPEPFRKGTLVFLEHSISGMDYKPTDWPKYFDLLNRLPRTLRPFVFCIHPSDLERGLGHELSQFGVPLVTLGYARDDFFVDRFYTLLSHFEFATSTGYGSQVFLCEEFGTQYFIVGSRREIRTGHEAVYGHFTESDFERQATIERVFEAFPPKSSGERSTLTEDALGLEFLDERYLNQLKVNMLANLVPAAIKALGLAAKKAIRPGGIRQVLLWVRKHS